MFENNNSSSNSTQSTFNLFMNILLFLLIGLVVINVLYYFFGINIVGWIKNTINGIVNTRQIDIDIVNKPPLKINVQNIKNNENNQNGANAQNIGNNIHDNNLMNNQNVGNNQKDEVFNIPGNYYDYPNAKALCSAYGARLAKYDEVENIYKNGGEWCNYGWSDEQMALFPTQQKTYDSLQKIKGHEHDCGRPGINGGYIANPQVKFGVNCYGKKPHITKDEEEYMENISPLPQTQEDIVFQKKIDYWKTQVDDIIVSPFNYNTWSKF